MEVFEVDEGIQELILNNGSEEEMYARARKNGFTTIKEDAIMKALEHVIPYEETNVFGSKVGIHIDEDVVAPAPEQLASASTQEDVPTNLESESIEEQEDLVL